MPNYLEHSGEMLIFASGRGIFDKIPEHNMGFSRNLLPQTPINTQLCHGVPPHWIPLLQRLNTSLK